ncbi:MAG: adenylate kinase [Clostridia bacterium]|nr:adenylate kinase [Clostridia bacterium]
MNAQTLPLGKRIIILGCPGSGKTTLALRLREKTGLPLVHLDCIWWRADKTHISREEFDSRLNAVMRGEKWIIDGDFSRTYEPRFAACDTVIFLDYSEECCLKGIEQRLGVQRSDVPFTDAALDLDLVEQVRAYRENGRVRVLELIKKHPNKTVLIFTSRETASEWLDEL